MSGQHGKLLNALAQLVVSSDPNNTLRVCIDGVDGAGKTTLADQLAEAVSRAGRPTVRASIDDFHHPKSLRYARGRDSAEGFYRDSYDYGSFRRLLLDAFGAGGSRTFVAKAFDHRRDAPVTAARVDAPANAALIVDGIFLQRPELKPFWDLAIFLQVDFSVSVPRGAGRGPDFGSPDVCAASNQRYIGGQMLYFEESAPADHAHIVVDYNDLTNPKIIKWPDTRPPD